MAALPGAYAVPVYDQVKNAEKRFSTVGEKKEYIRHLINEQPEATTLGWVVSLPDTSDKKVLDSIIEKFLVGTRQKVLTETYKIKFILIKDLKTPLKFEPITGEEPDNPADDNPGYRVWSGKSMPSSVTKKRKLDFPSEYAEDSPGNLSRAMKRQDDQKFKQSLDRTLDGAATRYSRGRSRHNLLRRKKIEDISLPTNDEAAKDFDSQNPLAYLGLDSSMREYDSEDSLDGIVDAYGGVMSSSPSNLCPACSSG